MKKEIKVYPDKNGRQKGISPEGKKFDSVSEFLKEKIIEILGEFDACYFCEDEGGLAYKIDLFIPKLLELFEAEKQKWVEEILPIDNLVEGKDAGTEYGEGYSNGFKSCLKALNQRIKKS